MPAGEAKYDGADQQDGRVRERAYHQERGRQKRHQRDHEHEAHLGHPSFDELVRLGDGDDAVAVERAVDRERDEVHRRVDGPA